MFEILEALPVIDEVSKMEKSHRRLVFAIVVTILFFIVQARGCTDPKGAAYTLSVSGYTNVEITGPVWFGGQDPYRTGFRAVAPNGAHVSGQVTSGLFNKGSTIRIY